jgi:DNA-directed RNA polymerase subunit F
VTQDEIIEMARQAGVRDDENIFEFSQYKYLERFAKLVAEKEREACAKLFELTNLGGLKSDVWLQNYTATILDGYAKAIRARGKA